MKSIVYGETLWDIFPEEKVIGGASFNFAAHMSHLGNETYFISAVGNDDLGKESIEEAIRHGIKPDLIQTNEHKTGATIVSLDENGLPSYNVLQNVAYDHISINEKIIESIRSIKTDFFYFNTLSQRGKESRDTVKKILENCTFPEIVCDINLRTNCFDKESLSLCMGKATIVKISDEEGHFLYDMGLIEDNGLPLPYAVAAKYPDIKIIAYTLGENGSVVLDTKNNVLFESGKPEKVKVVSTVGAGDCYCATFVSEYLKGKTIPEAIKAATERSCIVVAHREAVPF